MKNGKRLKIQYLIYALVAAALLLLLAVGYRQYRGYFEEKVSEERSSQLTETVTQVGTNFQNALDFNWDMMNTAKNLSEKYEYAGQDDLASMADWLDRVTDAADYDAFFVLLDDQGRCYDAGGQNGVWTDFDNIGTDERATFIADSHTYDGYYWAFVQELSQPIATADGSVTITHLAFLRSTATMEKYIISSAYDDVSETYVLNENGTRKYGNISQDDTLAVNNVLKALREADPTYGTSYEDVMRHLEEEGTITGECTYGGTVYCYSLYDMPEYQTVLAFLIPASSVAAGTVDMANSLVRILVTGALVLVACVFGFTVITGILRQRNALYRQNEENLRQQEETNRQLEQANESLGNAMRSAQSALAIAKSANHAKSNFLSNMSHDIRTPLNAILGFQSLLLNNVDNPEKVRDYTEKIGVSGHHLLSLINDILDMSRIESGKTTMEPKPFRLETLLDDLDTMIRPLAESKHQHFTLETDGVEKLTVNGDLLRLKQILVNLLSNANKYTPEGGNITLAVHQIGTPSETEATVRFAVRDDGVGMDAGFQNRVYEPFVREQNSTASGIQGTGLGLAITKNLVDLMGGIITLQSEPGKGSVFTVELTFFLAKDPPAHEETQLSVDAENGSRNVLEGRHFLVAEDNELNAEIICSLLEMEGASFEVARNGQEAVEIFTHAPAGTYDVILMDIQMPVMDGYGATRNIRASAHPEAASIPIAAMTANAFADDVQNALDAGMNVHISKPVDMDKLREFVAGLGKTGKDTD